MMMEIIASPIINSYWVIPGRFKAGEHPGIFTEVETRQRLQWLFETGIDFIIDLTESSITGMDYSACIIDSAAIFSRQVIYKRIPVQDFGTPTNERMVAILDLLDSALTEGKNVYLHCYAGMGRTGLVVGCFLVRHGVPGAEALDRIQELRNEITVKPQLSPETDEQRRMVKEWTKGR